MSRYNHSTLHASVLGYLDSVLYLPAEEVCASTGVPLEDAPSSAAADAATCAAPSPPTMVVPVLYLEGWAFDRRQTCCRARYVARPRHGGGYPFVCKELTAVDRVDVADAYHRSAVRGCGWAESVPLPLLPLAASEAASHVLELRRRDNDGGWEWVEVFDISDRVNTQIRAAHAAAVSAARVESLLRAPAARTAWGDDVSENDEDAAVVSENEDEDAVVSEDENEVIIVEDEKENEFTAVFMSA